MNRNKLKAKVDGFRTINNDGYSIEKEDVKDLIDEICDEVDSRICENCLYYRDSGTEVDEENQTKWGYCDKEENDVGLPFHNFGCNKFERKK